MLELISGRGLGYFNASLLGLGVNGAPGPSGGALRVNVATGALVVQSIDEVLSATGDDLSLLRTYNSLGQPTDGDRDAWRFAGESRLHLHGALNASGSRVTRTHADGHATDYHWNG